MNEQLTPAEDAEMPIRSCNECKYLGEKEGWTFKNLFIYFVCSVLIAAATYGICRLFVGFSNVVSFIIAVLTIVAGIAFFFLMGAELMDEFYSQPICESIQARAALDGKSDP